VEADFNTGKAESGLRPLEKQLISDLGKKEKFSKLTHFYKLGCSAAYLRVLNVRKVGAGGQLILMHSYPQGSSVWANESCNDPLHKLNIFKMKYNKRQNWV